MRANPTGFKTGEQMQIRDLGELEGKLLLFGGPYSNIQALDALMQWADDAGIPPERRICTGDVVAYGANPRACVRLVQRLGVPVVAGNCERNLAEGAEDCGCGYEKGTACAALAKDWYDYAQRRIKSAEREWMAALPDRLTFRHAGKRHVVIHGGAGDISRFLWPISFEDDFWHEISLLQEEVGAIDVVIAGHCGVPFERNIDGVHWINPGAIGLPPHDGLPETCFATLSEDGEVTLERLEYDVKGAVAAMHAVGLTQGYDRALQSGYWPSEDVLPKAMRRKGGSGTEP